VGMPIPASWELVRKKALLNDCLLARPFSID